MAEDAPPFYGSLTKQLRDYEAYVAQLRYQIERAREYGEVAARKVRLGFYDDAAHNIDLLLAVLRDATEMQDSEGSA